MSSRLRCELDARGIAFKPSWKMAATRKPPAKSNKPAKAKQACKRKKSRA
jgi:hypothetical protein